MSRLTEDPAMSNLERHAEYEMHRAGLYDSDADYGGMIPAAVMKLIRVHAAEGHSGASHALVMKIFSCVANFQTLTPITDDPKEWNKIDETIWQNKHDPAWFSKDGGKTAYSVNDSLRVTIPMQKATQP